ncbi:hypothetical protein DFP72DRAFT_1122637 [Ephemerocybe angulata]|uniref:Uncharacterized protein n=1 Tax=Ephemerocybe angulata TaxID=980116 RepID=A0A8H6HZC9_9AGAR|nr:hypothetical protein DFP72DRAFT_1122637 [Tulosesus angulatus]
MPQAPRTHLPSPPHFPDHQKSNFRFSSSFPTVHNHSTSSAGPPRLRVTLILSKPDHKTLKSILRTSIYRVHGSPCSRELLATQHRPPDADIPSSPSYVAHDPRVNLPRSPDFDTSSLGMARTIRSPHPAAPSHFNTKSRAYSSFRRRKAYNHVRTKNFVFPGVDMLCLGYWSLGHSPHAPNRPDISMIRLRFNGHAHPIHDLFMSRIRINGHDFLGSFWTPAVPVHDLSGPNSENSILIFLAALITIRRACARLARLSVPKMTMQVKLLRLALGASADSILPAALALLSSIAATL